MTDKKKRYEDTYSPVYDISGPQESHPEEVIIRTDPASRKKNENIKGKRVKPGKYKRPDKNVADKKEEADLPGASFVAKIISALSSETFRWISGLVLGALGVYLLVSFFSYFANCVADQAKIANSSFGSLPAVGNKGGEGGARLAEFFINESFGVGSFVIIIWLIALGLKLLVGRPKFKAVNFTIKCIVALITLSLIVGLLTISMDSPVNWGGYHGRYVNEYIVGFFGLLGGWILCFLLIGIFIIICLRDVIKWIMKKRNQILEKRRIAEEEREEERRKEREIEEMHLREQEELIKSGDAKAPEDEDENDKVMSFGENDGEIDTSVQGYDLGEDDNDNEEGGMPYMRNQYQGNSQEEVQNDDFPQVGRSSESESTENAEKENSDKANGGKTEESEDEVSDEKKMIVNVNQIAKGGKDNTGSALSFIKRMYKFPSPMILREGDNALTVDEDEQKANKEKIEETLLYHGIPITDISATVGPTVTLYEIRPEQGIKISKIKNLADDIALSLSAIGVRIIAPIPGKGTVGIEVANARPQTVSMRTIVQSRKYSETRFRLPVALGCTIGNDIYIADLTKMPHLLVAGATGQGKSVGLNAIISSILYKKRPDEVKFVMIDPKEVEFSQYAKIEKHYLAKIEGEDAIVTNMSKVVPTLNSLCIEMDNRYKLLRNGEVRNIEEYNAKILQNKLRESDGHKFMPYIVLVVDEFADLIMTSGKDVERPIARLAQKARAIGIHVIIATQRPSTNVITGIIKANFPVRIAFKVSSGIDSKTILDATGAQSLIGKGDMLIGNNTDLVRVQCAFIDTPEVIEICNYISRQPFNSGPYILPPPEVADEGEGKAVSVGELDPLFDDVAQMVVASGICSTSGVQRRFSIGYARAGKIVDQLEHYGIVGPQLGSKPRSILVNDSELVEILRSIKGI